LFRDDHRRLDAEVRALAKRLVIPLPDTAAPAQQEQVAELSGLSGAAFDRAWMSRQIAIHRQSRSAGRRQLDSGSDSQVKALARRAAPVIQAHLSILEETVGRRTPDEVEGGAGGQSGGEPVRSAPLGLGLVGVAVVLAAGALLVVARRRRA
jgi:putative membrane protein